MSTDLITVGRVSSLKEAARPDDRSRMVWVSLASSVTWEIDNTKLGMVPPSPEGRRRR
jgi:hypothetical protein